MTEPRRKLISVEMVNPDDSRCPECRSSFGVHLVECSYFHCGRCGRTGKSVDHFGGCPKLKAEMRGWCDD